MPTKSAHLQYIMLAVVMAFSGVFLVHGATAVWEQVFHGATVARPPMGFGNRLNLLTSVTPEASAAGLYRNAPVVSINGRPFTGARVLIEEVKRAHPGDLLSVVYLTQDGISRNATIHLAAVDTSNYTWLHIITQDLILRLLFPLCWLGLGCWVVLAKPRDPNAWLLFGIFNYFPSTLYPSLYWPGLWMYVNPFWGDLINTAGPFCIMLFGIYFPQRANWDKRLPWLKWIILGPVVLAFPIDLWFTHSFIFNFSSASWIRSFIGPLTRFESSLTFIAISIFFANLAHKIGITTNPDARRRLKVLYTGAAIANTPIALLLLYSLFRGVDIGDGVPQWILAGALATFALFPVTLAYVVIVQRAMDVRILVRQGTKYFFARSSIFVISVSLAVWMSFELNLYFSSHSRHRNVDLARIFSIVALFFAFRFIGAKRLQERVDQRFFREAYSAEQLLSELSEEARNFTEVAPLIDTISNRVGNTLHIDRIAIFLRSGDTFQLAYATGAATLPGASFSLPASSTTITTLVRGKGPANVYRDDPSSWLVDATDAERTALADLSTELLVPLPGRNRLIGVMALGPKRSQEPYSRTDRQLLQTVASQTGLALENAELLENLTAEVSQRERVSKEIEIAREVQQRLFPQSYPQLFGIDLAGYCRPAQAVGGDYYDFFLLPTVDGNQPRLAIAIGDISGKGISAALLMASLRASLRSLAALQAESGVADLTTLMRSVNRLVYDSSTSNRYATFFYAEFDPATRLLTYINAGHNPPVILRDTRSIELPATGTVIGLLPDAEYEQATLALHPGDVLLAFTDGISEAMTHEDEEWGEDRMIACAQAHQVKPGCSHSAGLLLECILAAADNFTAGAPQHDDMTLVLCTVS